MRKKQSGERRNRSSFFRMHPLFWVVGVYYAFKGELFLFLLSALVAIEHECAHAFAAARLGYKLNKIVLMPFGAVIDGDMRASFKDEMLVALWGPLCNLVTAGFFAAIWWFEPTVYAFTDTAYRSSLSIALVNLLPAYPLDGGRILQCALARSFSKTEPREGVAERKAKKICKIVTVLFACLLFLLFVAGVLRRQFNLSLCLFALFLLFGGLGNKKKDAFYEKMDISMRSAFKRGAEIKRVAVLSSCTVKDALRFLSRGNYLVLEVYDEKERHLFDLSQNEFAEVFEKAATPYTPIGSFAGILRQNRQKRE